MAAMELPDTRPSHRHIEILTMVAAGKTREEIADDLHLSFHTVKWYLAELRELMGARNTTHAVVLCIVAGYIHVDVLDVVVDEHELVAA